MDTASRQSYWEKTARFGEADVLVVGAGITGLNCAIELKSKAPSLRVLVVERSLLPEGASTRNAGFACFGSCSELLEDIQSLGETKTYALVEKRWRGLQALRNMLNDKVIDFCSFGGFEIFTEQQNELFEKCLAAIPSFNRILADISGFDEVFSLRNNSIDKFGFSAINNIIYNDLEGQLHPGKMLKALSSLAASVGVEIWRGLEVSSIAESGDTVKIKGNSEQEFSCRNIAITSNGFSQKLLPGIDIYPARGQVFLTEKIPGLKLKGVYHYDRGYVYFRDIDGRLLIGGGRNIDFSTEKTEVFGSTVKIEEYLRNILKRHILPHQDPKFEMQWSGIMGLGSSRDPIIQKVSDKIYCGVRLGGMGVAIGTLVGKELAELILQDI